jgi:phosphate transport system permease protein
VPIEASSSPLRLKLSLIAGFTHSNFLTGEISLRFDPPVELPLAQENVAQENVPSQMILAGAGNSLYLAWPNGSLERYDCSRLDDTYLAESGTLLDGQTNLEFLDFILGNNTLVWGDSEGSVQAGFLVRPEEATAEGLRQARRHPRADKILVSAKRLAKDKDKNKGKGKGTAAISMAASSRTRQVLVGSEDGRISMYNATSGSLLATFTLPSEEPVLKVVFAPKEDGLIAATPTRLYSADLDPRHPEASLKALFLPVWYEGYPQPEHTWQSSSGTDDFEIKLGLMPLIFGTIKATLYSMMFGVPLALLAALFTSEFLHSQARSFIKPGIEFMASLPSVVLGFLAALVFAPYIEKVVPATLASLFTLPFVFLLGAFLWQLLPIDTAVRLGNWRFFFMVLMVPLGFLLAAQAGPLVERFFFAGDLKGWLAWDPGKEEAERFRSGAGGWLLLWTPIAAVVVAMLIGRTIHPWMRAASVHWDRRRFALVDLAKFGLGLVATFALALGISYTLQSLGIDPRGGYLNTYVQRNALIVGLVMGFAIIPIIYTLSEDALATVPEHLRSASLGAGATPWQTATRIVIPTAMSGLFSAVMVGLGRAVGETMIVLMAAGNTPVLEWNIFEGFRTLSANIAVELPEAVQGSTHYRTLFLAALVLFIMTFIVNTIAEVIRQRFRRRAYQL